MELEKITVEFDTKKLMRDIREAIGDDEAALRSIEAKCGVSASTLSRIDNGHLPDMETFIKLVEAFSLQPNTYFVRIKWTGSVT